MKRVIVINSAKGGVGKTSVTTGIAVELVELGHEVSVIDLDVTTPNMEEIEGVKLYAPVTNSQMTKSQTKKFLKKSIDDAEGWILIDTPPTISSAYSAITETIQNAKFIFVTTPSKNAILDTSVGIKFFATRGISASGLIQNMIGDTFGSQFDSEKVMGVKTIGAIPLGENMQDYFSGIVFKLNELDFQSASTIGDVKKILSTITLKEAQADKHLPLKFYNLETWDYISEKLSDKELMSGAKSHYSISTSELSKIIDCGDTATIVMGHAIAVEKAPLPHEIQEAKITYDNPVSNGLPMFVLPNGVNIWWHECSLADDRIVKETLESGGIELGEGRIIQSLHTQLTLSRMYTRGGHDIELALVMKHIEVSKLTPSKKDIMYSMYLLEQPTRQTPYDDFDYEAYIREQEADYPDYFIHMQNLIEVAT